MAPSATAATGASHGQRRTRSAATGMASPNRAANSAAAPPGSSRSGKSRRMVSSAWAWSSAPAMTSAPDPGVAYTSFALGSVTPTTATFPRRREAGTRPASRSEKRTVSIVPGGPG